MKRYLLLLLPVALAACDSPAEIAAAERLDTACMRGDIQACAAVQERVNARNQALATSTIGM